MPADTGSGNQPPDSMGAAAKSTDVGICLEDPAASKSDISATSSSGQVLWHHAKEKVMHYVDFSMGFHTLRDMTGNHTLDPRKLKLICRLGSKGGSIPAARHKISYLCLGKRSPFGISRFSPSVEGRHTTDKATGRGSPAPLSLQRAALGLSTSMHTNQMTMWCSF